MVRNRSDLKRLTIPRLNKYIPHEPTAKQSAFLLLLNRDALYGGAAGGGKSDALLMAALQYVDIPGYNALIIRKTYKDLSLPDAIMSRSKEWLMGTDALWNEQDKVWKFPSGATLTFGYLAGPNDHYQYQGAAFHFIGIDEATQIPINQILYLFSRCRRPSEGVSASVPLRFRLASNPGGRSHTEIKERYPVDGVLRYDEELQEYRIFIPAGLDDNPYLDVITYKQNLNQLDPVTREQLLRGDWDIAAGGRMFKRNWFRLTKSAPPEKDIVRRVRAWDLAATEPSKKNPDPDYTVGTLMSYTYDGSIYVEHVIRFRENPGVDDDIIRQIADMDGRHVEIREEQEPGSSGKKVVEARAKLLAGYVYLPVPSTGSKAKRAAPFASYAESGNVYVVEGEWNSRWLDEHELFPDGGHDDQVDSASSAFDELTGGIVPSAMVM